MESKCKTFVPAEKRYMYMYMDLLPFKNRGKLWLSFITITVIEPDRWHEAGDRAAEATAGEWAQ